VLALLIGGSLGCAGALMRGGFGNPLTEPGVIGVSSGAAVGAVAAIALGLDFLGTWTVTAFAFAFGTGLATVLLVYAMPRSGGRTEVVTLILTGIALNAFTGALIGLFLFFADSAAVSQITFWQLGSLAQATWPKVLAVLPCAAFGLALAPLYARRLDLLALGERPARHLGVDIERLRIALVLVIALLTAAAVSVSGIIGFVGLVVPRSTGRRPNWPCAGPYSPSRRRSPFRSRSRRSSGWDGPPGRTPRGTTTRRWPPP
jgi:iron complex transport system permease protein